MFVTQLIIGTMLVCLTVVIHAVLLDRIMFFLEKVGPGVFKKFSTIWRIPILTIAVLGTFSSHIIQIWIWAVFYLFIDVLPDFESALYFSTSTFTTVGYGDIFLDKDWRLISSFQAANGFILFGWSTAFIFEIMSKLYERDFIRKTKLK